MAIIEGTAYWASLTRPNEKFEPMWRIDLAVDSKDAEDFKGQGISVAETTIDEKTIPNIIRFKRKVFSYSSKFFIFFMNIYIKSQAKKS